MGILLSAPVRIAVAVTAMIDLGIGLAFFFSPELSVTLWTSPVSPTLSRFIGAIIIGNGVGAALIARLGTWESARVLFTVALVYGVIVMLGLLYHFMHGDLPSALLIYLGVDVVFLVPIGFIYWRYEQGKPI
jgi:hypothetical protein